MQETNKTVLPVIAHVSRIVSRVVDRLMGDRVDHALLVAAGCVEALKVFEIQAQMVFGEVAWVQVLKNHEVIWVGCWGESQHFWVVTEYHEIVDLNASVAYRKPFLGASQILYSPPMLWSDEIPAFYRYQEQGNVELDLMDHQEARMHRHVLDQVSKACKEVQLHQESLEWSESAEWIDEPILCSGRRLKDDSRDTFKFFDRIVSIRGIPQAPI